MEEVNQLLKGCKFGIAIKKNLVWTRKNERVGKVSRLDSLIASRGKFVSRYARMVFWEIKKETSVRIA